MIEHSVGDLNNSLMERIWCMTRHPRRKRRESLKEFISYKKIKVKRVLRFYDGDTIRVQLADGMKVNVRFLLVDTPELYPKKGRQPFARAAKAFTKRILMSSEDIRISRDREIWDQYGRLLAYVYCDGKLIQEYLVESGYARVYHTKNKDKKKIKRLYDLQEQAKKKRKNIWKFYHYVGFDGFHPEAVGRGRAVGMVRQLVKVNKLFESLRNSS